MAVILAILVIIDAEWQEVEDGKAKQAARRGQRAEPVNLDAGFHTFICTRALNSLCLFFEDAKTAGLS